MTVRRAFAAGTGLLLVAALGAVGRGQARAPQSPTAADTQVDLEAVVTRYCVGCHNTRTTSGGIAFDTANLRNVAAHPELWEKALRRLRARAMPPASAPRPDEPVYQRLVADLERELDRAAAIRPNPGRTEPFRRLNRSEYQRAIRDLLDLDVDVAELLPADDASFGFDNVSVAGLSPTLMERYLGAAQKISRLAVGRDRPHAGGANRRPPRGSHAGGAARRDAVRHPRRRRLRACVSAGWRLHHRDPAGARPQ